MCFQVCSAKAYALKKKTTIATIKSTGNCTQKTKLHAVSPFQAKYIFPSWKKCLLQELDFQWGERTKTLEFSNPSQSFELGRPLLRLTQQKKIPKFVAEEAQFQELLCGSQSASKRIHLRLTRTPQMGKNGSRVLYPADKHCPREIHFSWSKSEGMQYQFQLQKYSQRLTAVLR